MLKQTYTTESCELGTFDVELLFFPCVSWKTQQLEFKILWHILTMPRLGVNWWWAHWESGGRTAESTTHETGQGAVQIPSAVDSLGVFQSTWNFLEVSSFKLKLYFKFAFKLIICSSSCWNNIIFKFPISVSLPLPSSPTLCHLQKARNTHISLWLAVGLEVGNLRCLM